MKPNKHLKWLKKEGQYILFFLCSWLLLWLYYGDVLYIAQQNSFFTWNAQLMQFVTKNQPYGYLWWLGRGILQLFYFPVLGSLIVSLMLTAISKLFHYVFFYKKNSFFIQFLLAFLWLFYIFYQGYDLYYQRETGRILGIPFCILIILTLQSSFIFTFRRKRSVQVEYKKSRLLAAPIVFLGVTGILILWNETFRAYVRPTAHMQRALQNENWDEMKKTAVECKVSARPIAAYYAIALLEKGEITQSLFDIEYNYEEIFLHDRGGKKDYGTAYYEADCNFHAGLINTAYRNAMERLTMEGPSALVLKILIESSLLNKEYKLCDKYLEIMHHLPFEKDFIKKIESLRSNQTQLAANTRLNKIINLIPTKNAFETQFREPLFLGYNITLLEGRSWEALDASLAACLYSKMLPDFLLRTEPLIGSYLPQNIQDALIMQSLKNPQISKAFNLDQMSQYKYRLFLIQAQKYTKNKAEGAEKLKEEYMGYYPYYYFFGNTSSDTNTETNPSEKSKNQVN